MNRSRPRTPASLSPSVHRRLNMYALAASAAGVSLLALAPPSEAEIIYTKAHVVLGARSYKIYPLDLNHDKIVDFFLDHVYFTSHSGNTLLFDSAIFVPFYSRANKLNRVADKNKTDVASAFRAGDKIGPSAFFWSSGQLATAGGTVGKLPNRYLGEWGNEGKGLKDRYLGFRFAIRNKTHYGWARVSVSAYPFAATLTGYAYETIPNKPIIAGKITGSDVVTVQSDGSPTTLGRLAVGRK
jgi:hypothetical protein